MFYLRRFNRILCRFSAEKFAVDVYDSALLAQRVRDRLILPIFGANVVVQGN